VFRHDAFPLLKVTVTRKEWMQNTNHPLKKHPIIKANGVPSLYLFNGTEILHKAEFVKR